MNEIYRKVAEAVNTLSDTIKPETTIPLGFEGAVTYHLLSYAFQKKGIMHKDNLSNVVQVSSKTEQFDREKFRKIFEDSVSFCMNRPVYVLDMRTKTGKLGEMLKSEINNSFLIKNFRYTVLFDPNRKADIRATEEELTDEERKELLWVDSPEKLEDFIKFKDGTWEYLITHDKLASLRHVPEIKKLI